MKHPPDTSERVLWPTVLSANQWTSTTSELNCTLRGKWLYRCNGPYSRACPVVYRLRFLFHISPAVRPTEGMDNINMTTCSEAEWRFVLPVSQRPSSPYKQYYWSLKTASGTRGKGLNDGEACTIILTAACLGSIRISGKHCIDVNRKTDIPG